MTKGQPVQPGSKLTPYNAKLEPSTKALLTTLVQVQKLSGQRELIERMLREYEVKYPDDFIRAREIAALLER